MGSIFNNNKTIPLTEAQKKSWVSAIVEMDDTFLPAIAWQGEGTEHKHVFVASFDGTWNDRENLRDGEASTNPAVLEAELSKLYNSHLDGQYYNGVGTRENGLMRVLNGMTGGGSEQRAEQAFKDFQHKAQDWLKADPEAQIQVFAMGFSRGAASARHFLNLVDERGVPADDGRKQKVEDPYTDSPRPNSKIVQVYDHFLRQPGTVTSSALLYDTVATGQEQILKLGIPSSTHYVVHLTSQDENRKAFPLMSLSAKSPDLADAARFMTLALPGVHSDIGGGYNEGVSKLAEYLGSQVLYRFGFEIEPGPAPWSALAEGQHRHMFRDPGTSLEEGFDRSGESTSPERATHYAPNETLTNEQKSEVMNENRELTTDAGVRYVEDLVDGTAPKDPQGLENYGIALTPKDDGTMEVLLSNPNIIKFDEITGVITVYGEVVGRLSEQDYAQLKAGESLVDVFTVAPLQTLEATAPAQPILGKAPKTSASPQAAETQAEQPVMSI